MNRNGFTTSDICIIVGMTGILMSIVNVAIGPFVQGVSLIHQMRLSESLAIENAINQHLAHEKKFPGNIVIPDQEALAVDICRQKIHEPQHCMSITELVPMYLKYIPVDPAEQNKKLTGYKVFIKNKFAYVKSDHIGNYNIVLQ